jgi:hypothetical protein
MLRPPSDLAWWELLLSAFLSGAVACLFGLFSDKRNWFARLCLALTYLFVAASVFYVLVCVIRFVRWL